MSEWDDEDFEPPAITPQPINAFSNKWEGEDEEEEVKESWEDEDEEVKPAQDEAVAVATAKPKKKALQDKIAEKERQKREEYEKKLKEQEEEKISPAELVRRQQDSDLTLALETTFGGNNNDSQPKNSSREEFLEIAENLTKQIQQFSKNDEYPAFTETVVRGICATLTSFDLKKIKTTVDNLYLEKQKLEKGDKTKKKGGKGKAKLKMEGENLNQYSAYVDDYVDYDDFM